MATTARETIGVPLPSAERVAHERLMAVLRNELGERYLAEATQIGRQMTPEAAAALAYGSTPDMSRGVADRD